MNHQSKRLSPSVAGDENIYEWHPPQTMAGVELEPTVDDVAGIYKKDAAKQSAFEAACEKAGGGRRGACH